MLSYGIKEADRKLDLPLKKFGYCCRVLVMGKIEFAMPSKAINSAYFALLVPGSH